MVVLRRIFYFFKTSLTNFFLDMFPFDVLVDPVYFEDLDSLELEGLVWVKSTCGRNGSTCDFILCHYFSKVLLEFVLLWLPLLCTSKCIWCFFILILFFLIIMILMLMREFNKLSAVLSPSECFEELFCGDLMIFSNYSICC